MNQYQMMYHMMSRGYGSESQWISIESQHMLEPISDLYKHSKCRALVFQLNPTHPFIISSLQNNENKFRSFTDFQSYLDSIMTLHIKPTMSALQELEEINSMKFTAIKHQFFNSKTCKLEFFKSVLLRKKHGKQDACFRI